MNLFGTRYALEILTVCTANICRSPMAECILREELKMRGLGKKVNVSSAGTHVARPGVMADARARAVCARHGVDLRRCRTRQVTEGDFDQFRFILAMDERNYGWLCREFPSGQQNSISLIGTWAQGEALVRSRTPILAARQDSRRSINSYMFQSRVSRRKFPIYWVSTIDCRC